MIAKIKWAAIRGSTLQISVFMTESRQHGRALLLRRAWMIG
ncbi:hypothetical protein [Rhodanobacter aciditrophus]